MLYVFGPSPAPAETFILIKIERIHLIKRCEPYLDDHPGLDVPELEPNEGGDVVVLIVVRIIVAGKALIIIKVIMMIHIMIRIIVAVKAMVRKTVVWNKS